MALHTYLTFEEIPGGSEFLEDVKKRYKQTGLDSLIKSGLKLDVTLNPIPELSFDHTNKNIHMYDYYIMAKGIYRFNLRDIAKGKIVGLQANLVSIKLGVEPSERYDSNTNLDCCILSIPLDNKNRKSKKEIILCIEYAKLAEFDF
ncbi:MAG: hypothetical protein ACP5N1_00090 [Candidatus Woesearchaeota archaeon]